MMDAGDFLNNLALGLLALLNVKAIALMVFGTAIGIAVGAIPGLSGTMAVAVLVPVTFVLEPVAGLAMLAGIYNGAIYGGAITAILMRIPGTPAAVVTIFDGYEMTRQGKSAVALEAAISSSTVGGIISVLVLLLVAPPLVKIALMFGPAEYFWVAMFGLSIVASLSSNSMIKGLIAGAGGVFISVIGLDPQTAFARFTFDVPELLSGFDVITVMIGLFALPQAFTLLGAASGGDKEIVKQSTKRAPMFGQFRKFWKTYIRSAIVGTIVGIIPAAGGNIASFVSYDLAKRRSKNPETFGTGEVEGVIASEGANNGITGGSFVPLLTLGIPGSTTTAAIMGAFMVHGLDLGPQLFTDNPEVVYALIWALFLTNIVMFLMGYFGATAFIRILRVPDSLMAAGIIVFCVIGAFVMRSNIFDIYMLFAFGVLGYIMEKMAFPLAPLVLGVVLGPLIETNLLRALTISHGNFFALFNSVISWIFVVLTLLSFFGALKRSAISNIWQDRFRKRNEA
ncbi:tripartite tricarboxylate transporter permease [Shumkonia mesophila]|uniref:tripartite tricarboxylate transporter permease n=1 Tax=Shumkonia mesophila TaxID=2838854 RepID=UPI002934255C|nr:tripartite tricarboxylate transporter permease [Shumkonia mesophila]